MALKDPDEYPDTLEYSTDVITDSSTLSEREVQVLQMRYEGHSDAEIADELGVEEGTVSSYASRAVKKADKAKNTLMCVIEAGTWSPMDDIKYRMDNVDEYQED
ncbi:helix-turn-helix domain-containing protein [Haloarcula amylolytica]|uniref:helix-turn-helix domain-containing protein n=1 Tax=Haloarcula amylolytica TaxID=396317 RepID=UPI003C75A28C